MKLFKKDVGVRGVSVDERGDVVEPRFPPAFEGTPEAALFPWPEDAHVEHTIAVLIFEDADRPATARNFELESGLVPYFQAYVLSRFLEEAIGLPESDMDDVLARRLENTP